MKTIKTLFFIMTVGGLVGVLFSLVFIGFNRMTAQAYVARDDVVAAASTIVEHEESDSSLISQQALTDSNASVFQGEVEAQAADFEIIDDLQKNELSISSTGSGQEFIPTSALRSDGAAGAAVGYRFSVLGVPFPGGYVRSISNNAVCMSAPVYLPNGANVTEFSMYLMDNDPTSNIGDAAPVTLWRRNHAFPDTTAEVVASFIVPGNVSDTIVRRWFISPIAGKETVSNSFGYYATFCFNGGTELNHLVYGLRVDYTP